MKKYIFDQCYLKVTRANTDIGKSYQVQKQCSGGYRSSPAAPESGTRLLKSAAFPFIRATERRWKRCWMVVCSSSQVWRARALPSFTTSATATGCQAPNDSRDWLQFSYLHPLSISSPQGTLSSGSYQAFFPI